MFLASKVTGVRTSDQSHRESERGKGHRSVFKSRNGLSRSCRTTTSTGRLGSWTRLLMYFLEFYSSSSFSTMSKTLYAEKKSSFPISLKFVDFVRRTNTDSKCFARRSRTSGMSMVTTSSLGVNWFHPGHLVEYNPSRGIHVVYKEIKKNTFKQRPGPSVYGQRYESNMSKNSQQKEKRHWDIDKPKLDNARRLGGTCHSEPEDTEIEEPREKKSSKDVGSDLGFCNAVQIAKDLREYILKGGERPGRDKFRPAPAERTFSHNQHKREGNCVCMHLSILRVYEKAHDRESQNREVQSLESLYSCAQALSFAPSNEKSGRKSCSRQRVREMNELARLPREENQKKNCCHSASRKKKAQQFILQLFRRLSHLHNSELEPQFQNAKMSGRIPRRCREGRFRLVRFTHRASIVSITNDSRQSHGHYIKTTEEAEDKQVTQYPFTTMSKWRTLLNDANFRN